MYDKDTTLLIESYQQIVEKDITRSGPKTIDRQDISNLIYKLTDGGRELFSIYTSRKTDSRTDPKKKAGQPMKITGRYGTCKASLKAAQFKRPELNTKVQYSKNDVLRMCVTEVDGVDYVKLFSPDKRTRSFDVTSLTKIEAGGETYDIV
jgi:hypothetical protein